MQKEQRLRLHFLVLTETGGALFISPDPVEALPLGPSYAKLFSKLNRWRADLFNQIVADLSAQTDDQITEDFDKNGKPISEKAQAWQLGYRQEVRERFGKLRDWFTAPLFQTSNLADFEHWGRADFLTLDEIVWLSVGLEPKEKFIESIKPFNMRGATQKLDQVAQYMSRHREIIRRKLDPHGFNKKPDLLLLREWIEGNGLEVHQDFLKMLPSPPPEKQTEPATKAILAHQDKTRMDGRERVTMTKLIAAMAIDGYGFNPKAKRSEIPKEIEDIADQLGLSVSRETIRKYLKEGSELLPENWKPD
ncbi:hypothetical protein [Marivita sp.]|uniref:hypothetical protein n=1 Tax=Marivita sp. TaxID=2003365 RepID=UPI003F4AA4EF